MYNNSLDMMNPPIQTSHGLYEDKQSYQQYGLPRGISRFSTLPARKTQHNIIDSYPERSVTPDITRGLENNQYTSQYVRGTDLYRNTERHFDMPQTKYYPNSYAMQYGNFNNPKFSQNLGIPVQIPTIFSKPSSQVPSQLTPKHFIQTHHISSIHNDDDINESLKISPIDPRNCAGFQSSTPSSKAGELRAASNLDAKLLSPKKSTMSNEELYAIIHKSKKKMNIKTDDGEAISRSNPSSPNQSTSRNVAMKSPETGYLNEKPRSRLSWSPSNGEYMDFNTNVDKSPPSIEARSRQSWSCTDRKGSQQTSRLDFKRLLLQHGKTNISSPISKKLSAVEQLKLSKQQLETQKDVSILELSGSPKTFGSNRKFFSNAPPPGSPRTNTDKIVRPVPKLLSPRSQWRFANPRSDVLSSTIVEDCREEETCNKLEKENDIPKTDSRNSTNNLSNVRKQIFIESNVQKSSIHKLDDNKMTISERIKAQRDKFFNAPTTSTGGNIGFNKFNTISANVKESKDKPKPKSPPTLETAF